MPGKSNARAKHLIRNPEGVSEGCRRIGDTEQVLVGDDDKRIDRLAQFSDTGLSDPHAATAFKVERLGDDGDRKDTHLASGRGDDRGSACARAAAHAGGEENHVRAGEAVANFLQRLLGRRLADLRSGAGAETLGQLKAHLDNSSGVRRAESLRVSVSDDEVDPGQAGGDHIVDRVAPGAADAAHHYAGLQFFQLGGLQIDRHTLLSLGARRCFTPARAGPSGTAFPPAPTLGAYPALSGRRVCVKLETSPPWLMPG